MFQFGNCSAIIVYMIKDNGIPLHLQVTDISESVFNKVPRKSHLNSGFSVTEMTLQGEQVYNLLAEVQ